ncbi:MAG: VWA domain-containing protein [Candidatus Binatia bacterium]
MRDRLVLFIAALRAAGLDVSVGETLDALRAIGAIGLDAAPFRESLAATLVKDEADRPAFDSVFERFFALPARERSRGRRRSAAVSAGHGTGPSSAVSPHTPMTTRRQDAPNSLASPRKQAEPERRGEYRNRGRRLARDRTLARTPFGDMSPADVEACEALVAALAARFRAHLSRRQRAAAAGRLDLRRTLRRSVATGGVPLHPALRHRRPGRPDLVALCDVSYSVAVASRFLLSLLAPAASFCRRVRLFAFVDRPIEVSIEHGNLVPHEAIDWHARSDFGRVLAAFRERHAPLLTRSTILLILGDARNNRRPPRADLLRQYREAVRQITWLNPELPARWNTGDSVIAAYAPHCDAVLGATNLHDLSAALRRTFRAP